MIPHTFATAIVLSVLVPSMSLAKGGPVLKSVAGVVAAQSQTITIRGGAMGNTAPYNGDSPYIHFYDCKSYPTCAGSGEWEAGNSGDGNAVGLIISSWTNKKIVIGGFDGDYGGEYSLSVGDTVLIEIINPQTGAYGKKSYCYIVVGSGPGVCPGSPP